MPTRLAPLCAALALALATHTAVAQSGPAAPHGTEAAIVVPESAPPGASAQVGMGALIGLVAGVLVVAIMVGGS
jgi:hypothetical protein